MRPEVENKIGKGKNDEEYKMACILSIDFLLGKDDPEPGAHLDEKTKDIYRIMYKKVPSFANKIREIPVFDSYFAAFLDFKNNKLTELIGDEWLETAEAKRVHKIIKNTPEEIENDETYKKFYKMMMMLK